MGRPSRLAARNLTAQLAFALFNRFLNPFALPMAAFAAGPGDGYDTQTDSSTTLHPHVVARAVVASAPTLANRVTDSGRFSGL